MSKVAYHWLDKQASLKRFYTALQKDNDVLQVTVTNHTKDIRKVCLWGAHSKTALSTPDKISQLFSKKFTVGKNPLDVVYNPISEICFIANSDSDSISMISKDGLNQKLLDVHLLSNVELKGPVSIALNNNPLHPNYGYIAVACQRADQVLFYNAFGKFVEKVNTGIEPVRVVFNSHNNCFYVANSKSDYITKIDDAFQAAALPNLSTSIHIAVNERNGDLLVYDRVSEVLILTSANGNNSAKLEAIKGPLAIAINLDKKVWYVGLEKESKLLVLDIQSLEIVETFHGLSPLKLTYNEAKRQITFLDSNKEALITLNDKFEEVDSESVIGYDNYTLINDDKDHKALLSASSNQLKLWTSTEHPTVTVNEDYYEDREDFQHNPAMVRHVKIVASGEDRINALQIIEKSVTGTEICKTISLSNSQSPQNFANVSEVFDFDGNLIDGHVMWCFKINPLQQVSFLIYYHQIEMYHMLPEKTRISTGVQMSKGIPVSWLDNPKDEPPNVSTY